MIALILSLLIATDPVAQPVDNTTVTRAGIIGRAVVTPPAVSLIGEVNLTLTVEGYAPLAVESIVFPNPPGWRVRAAEPPLMTDPAGGRQQWRQVFRLTPDRPGELALPPPAIRVRAGGRDTPVEINWHPLTVKVTTSLPRAELDEARGVTGPEPAPPATPMIWQDERFWAVLIVIVAVVAAVLAGRGLRAPPPPEPSAAEWAASELDHLRSIDPANPESADALAKCLRGYLNRRYHIPAPGKNTPELLTLLGDNFAETLPNWRSLLEHCDVARFAGAGFSTGEWTDALNAFQRLITETFPVGESTSSAADGPTGEMA